MKSSTLNSITLILLLLLALLCSCKDNEAGPSGAGREITTEQLSREFQDPPADARPWVYWINMDGHFDMDGITADLESIKKAGLGGVLFMEVDLGIPRGNVNYMTPQWQEHMKHAISECERLGLEFSLIGGPGWTGSGGPWISAEQSMQHLLPVSIEVEGPLRLDTILPLPGLRVSPFHLNQTPGTREQISNWSEDVALFAFPRCEPSIRDIEGRALYRRNPYTSMMGVPPYLPPLTDFPEEGKGIDTTRVIDLTGRLDGNGRLRWEVPPGEWTILRMCSRSTGAITRPAPLAGVGLESNKFEKEDLDHHFDTYIGKLMEVCGRTSGEERPASGWNTLQFESWEMSSQNWSKSFREEFRKRRGYDLWPYLPVLSGRTVESQEISDRFLWDLRLTSQDLILENHARHLLKRAHENGFELHIEPHDMNPTTDMLLAGVGDVPMAEFWTNHFNSAFSVHQAASTGHIFGKRIVAAEAFTSFMTCWSRYPYRMKNQGDWAFSSGINRFVFVQYTHKPWQDDIRPGMGFGPHGIYWDRKQTFWPLVGDYHRYISRCQHMLRQGNFVADICYLLPEGAPNVFVPPPSALRGDKWTPDRKGYNFDGCPPAVLMEQAEVRDGKIVFPSGASYHILVLPDMKAMTPELLRKIEELATAGATIVGSPPFRAPGLSDYPACDREVDELVLKIWGSHEIPAQVSHRRLGKGTLWWGGGLSLSDARNYDRNPADEMSAEEKQSDYAEGLFGHDGTRPGTPYPAYEPVKEILDGMGIPENFKAADEIRYVQLAGQSRDIFFVSNSTEDFIETQCRFRSTRGQPRLWDPVTGGIRDLPSFTRTKDGTLIDLQFESYQSFFIIFEDSEPGKTAKTAKAKENFPSRNMLMEVGGAWTLEFDPAWGGPGEVVFEELGDWTGHSDEGIRYYSGIVNYTKEIYMDPDLFSDLAEGRRVHLHLGKVHDMAGITLNGKKLGCVWTAPWSVDVSEAIRAGENHLEIKVANRWPNRLIGDEHMPYDGIVNGEFPAWITGGKERTSGRYTYTTLDCFDAGSPLLPSGLLGPVVLEVLE